MEYKENAVIYARFSSSGQREESIEGQLRECKAFAERFDLNVIGEYCDHALTGTSDKRPQQKRAARLFFYHFVCFSYSVLSAVPLLKINSFENT